MKNKSEIKEKIIPVFLFLLGLFLLFENFKSFLYSIELYKTFRLHRDFNGCIYAGKQALPFFEFATSIVGFLFGLILIKKLNIFLKIMITYSLSFTIYYLFASLIKVIYCLIYDCSSSYKILESGGILFFTLLLSHYYKFDWKKEIKNLWYLKIIIFVLIIFGIKLILINL